MNIRTTQYKMIAQQFCDWLRLLNFEPTTVRDAPRKAEEFLNWLENNKIEQIGDINKNITNSYFDYLRNRQNKRKGGLLSKPSIRKHATVLRKLAKYLQQTGRETFEVDVKLPGRLTNDKIIFTKAEIKKLYESCESDVLGTRDKAMLSVYYGCGLRKGEGIGLDVTDIIFNKNLIYVRKGKNYKQRYVPLTDLVAEDLSEYLENARPMLLQVPTNAFFLNKDGKRLGGSWMAERLQSLKKRACIDKRAGLHALRHSIATHLLQSGMKLVEIQKFLGHSSLESTQIYTRVINE